MKKYSQDLLSTAPSRLMMAMAASAIVAAPAHAQNAPAAPQAAQSGPAAEPTVAPVVVKGTRENATPQAQTGYKVDTSKVGRTEQAVKDIPQSLTTVTNKLITDRAGDSFTKALTNVAGLSFNAGEGGRIGDNLQLRGYSANGDIYENGMRDIAQYNRETFNLDRIDILRGGASMIFGRGSTGGVINAVTKSPYLLDENKIGLTLGNNDYLRNTLDLNKVTGETSALRLNTMYTTTSGDPEGADSKRYGFAPTFRTGIGTKDEFELGYYHLNYDDTPNYGFAWAGGRPVDSTANKFYGLESDFQRDSADVVNGVYTHRFSSRSQIRNATRYGIYKRDLWATTARLPAGTVNVTDNTTVTRGSQRRGGEEHHLFNVTDFTSKFTALGMKHDTLLGMELAREESERWSYAGTPNKANGTVGDPYATSSQPISATGMRTGFNYFTASTVGLYAQDLVEFVPKWKWLAGVRWDRFSGDYSSGAGSSAVRQQRRDYLWSYRTGLIFQPTDVQSYYVSYGTAFNTSGDLYQYDTSSSKTPPEESRNIEAGTKFEFFEGNLQVRTALFRSEKYNERSTDTETPAGAFLLSGKRRTEGYELEVAGRINEKWDVFMNFAHMWSNIMAAGSSSASAQTVGKPAGNTPTNSGSLWTTYKFAPKWSMGGGMDGQSKRNPSHNSANWAPGFVKYDAMLKFEETKYDVQLNINNLFNRTYWLAVYNGHAVAGPRRTVQMTGTYKF
ncbi:MAG: TonB-dependent receptor [Rhodocyclaceae bacterium]